jgi:hypothetical protein
MVVVSYQVFVLRFGEFSTGYGGLLGSVESLGLVEFALALV